MIKACRISHLETIARKDPQNVIMKRIYDCFVDRRAGVDDHGNDEWEYWRDCINHVIGRAFEEGKALYEKP